MNDSMVSGKDLKSAIEKLIDLLKKKSVADFSQLIPKFNDLCTTFSDDILYPTIFKDLLRQGIEDTKENGENSVLQRDLYHKCLLGIHHNLALKL